MEEKIEKNFYVYKSPNNFTVVPYPYLNKSSKKLNFSGCLYSPKNYTGNCIIIVDMDFGKYLFLQRENMRPLPLVFDRKFTGNYKKNSKNTQHRLHTGFGELGRRIINHYAEPILKELFFV